MEAFLAASSIMRRWAAEQARTEAMVSALAAFDERRHLLATGASEQVLGVLSSLPGAVSGLQAKNARGRENLLGALRSSAARFEALQGELAELHAAAWQRDAKQAAERPAEEACSAVEEVVGAGSGRVAQRIRVPSALQRIEWLGELDAAFTRELLLKLQLLDLLCDAPTAEAHARAAWLWSTQPNLEPAVLERTDALARALSLES